MKISKKLFDEMLSTLAESCKYAKPVTATMLEAWGFVMDKHAVNADEFKVACYKWIDLGRDFPTPSEIAQLVEDTRHPVRIKITCRSDNPLDPSNWPKLSEETEEERSAVMLDYWTKVGVRREESQYEESHR